MGIKHPIMKFSLDEGYQDVVKAIPFEELPKYINIPQLYCRHLVRARLAGKPFLTYLDYMKSENLYEDAR